VSTVVELKTRPVEVNENVVETLRHALAQAEAGQIKAVAVVGIMPDMSVMTAASSNDCLPSLVGALAILQHRLLNDREVV
jgi:hypothetical protein